MKYCKRCKNDLSLDFFHKDRTKKDGLNAYCKICTTKKVKEAYMERTEEIRQRSKAYYHATKDKPWLRDKKRVSSKLWRERTNQSEKERIKRIELKEQAVAYLGDCCELCGYNECIAALDFHHRDPNEKDFNISNQVRSGHKIFEKIKSELDKCMLVCSNCHREIHFKGKN